MQGSRTEVIKRDRKVAFRLPDPVRSGGCSWWSSACPSPTGRTTCSRRSTSPSNAATASSSSAQRCGQVVVAAMPGRGPDAERGVGGARVQRWSATSPRSTSRSTRPRRCSRTWTTPCSSGRPTGASCWDRSGSPGRRRARTPARSPVANERGCPWPCWPPVGPTCSCSTSRRTTWTRRRWRRSGRCSPVVGHHRGGQPRPPLRRGAGPDACAAPPRRTLRVLARRVPRRGRDPVRPRPRVVAPTGELADGDGTMERA